MALYMERTAADAPVYVDVWGDGAFTLEPYTDGIAVDYHKEVPVAIDEGVVAAWYHQGGRLPLAMERWNSCHQVRAPPSPSPSA